jgi:branched-subunit amino acid ABC-type transport system permease component
MDVLRDILISAVTLGALYAASSIALSMIWGCFGMLNLAHGAFITVGAYASLLAVNAAGLPWWLGIAAGAAGGTVAGLVTHVVLVQWTFGKPNFQVNIIITTMALASISIDLINNVIGPTTARQPFNLDGRIQIGGSGIAYLTVLIVATCGLMVVALQWVIHGTSLGRSIRAVSQETTAALLNGVPVKRVVLMTMLIAGAVAGASGVLLTAWTTVYPSVGFDPLLKALIISIVGGLGSIPGALAASFILAFFEVFVQYTLGVKWGFPALLLTTMAILVLRPNGLFGQKVEARN